MSKGRKLEVTRKKEQDRKDTNPWVAKEQAAKLGVEAAQRAAMRTAAPGKKGVPGDGAHNATANASAAASGHHWPPPGPLLLGIRRRGLQHTSDDDI